MSFSCHQQIIVLPHDLNTSEYHEHKQERVVDLELNLGEHHMLHILMMKLINTIDVTYLLPI